MMPLTENRKNAGRPVRDGLVCALCLVSCAVCFKSPAFAKSVVVQTDVFVEPEESLELWHMSGQGEETAVVETELVLKGAAGLVQETVRPAVREKGIFSAAAPVQGRILSEDEILRVNESLRRAIEQSRRLREEKRRLDKELMSLRGANRLDRQRFESMEAQIRDYEGRLQRSVKMKEDFDQVMAEMQNKIELREQALLSRIDDLQMELERYAAEAETQEAEVVEASDAAGAAGAGVSAEDAAAKENAAALAGRTSGEALEKRVIVREMDEGSLKTSGPEPDSLASGKQATADRKPSRKRSAADQPVHSVVDVQQAGLDMIALVDNLNDARRMIRDDEAKIYYNMGNIFFHQGQYSQAAAEYRKALEIAPADASAHFNLAYVSGEFLHDYQTAMEHFQQYLFLNPGAEETQLVRQKILELRTLLSTRLGAGREHELQENKQMRSYNW